MTEAKAEEYRIIRRLVGRVGTAVPRPECPTVRISLVAERVIAVLAATAVLFVLGGVAQELLWATIAAASVASLAEVK